MIFNRIVEIVSAAATRLSAPKSSTLPYVSSGLSPPANSIHNFGFGNSKLKKNLRLSSSLQDFSSFLQLEPAGDDFNSGSDASLIQAKQPHALQRGNAGASFSKERASPGSIARKKWVNVLMVLLCLLLFAVLVLVFHFYNSKWSQGTPKFYVVLDCGSTGTRVYIYQASVNHNKDGSFPILLRSLPEDLQRKPKPLLGRAYSRMETEPGFDKLVHNVSGLRKVLKPLIQWAEKQIPKNAHKTTSLFLCATAGVRRLPISDSEWLLINAWSILKNSPFSCKREWIRIITGMEEAYYGWIALNYHTGVLGALPKRATFGALDLGGSSLQITFESNEQTLNETSLKLSIGPVNYRLSAYSLSGYGLNDAFDKSVAYLLKRLPKITNADLDSGNFEIKHPCLQSGYKEQYFCSQCASIYRKSGGLSGGKGFGKGRKSGIPIRLVGVPKWEECQALAKVAVNLSQWSDLNSGIDCELQPCALADNLPRPYGQFYAMSGFFVVYRFLNLTSDAALDDVLERGQEFCEKTWDIAKHSVPPQPFIDQYCFRAPYVVFLLREGLHISDRQVIVGSGSITWTLGVALLEAGKAFSTKTQDHSYEIVLQLKIKPVILFAILLASIVILICALTWVGNWMPRFFLRPYLPLFRHNSGSSTSVFRIPTPFRFQRFTSISSGDERVKMPLSPTIADTQQRPFGPGNGFCGSSIELTKSSLNPSTSSVSHSYSSGSLGQMQFDNGVMASFWPPHRSQMHLQSRRSQSREDLNSSFAEANLMKV